MTGLFLFLVIMMIVVAIYEVAKALLVMFA